MKSNQDVTAGKTGVISFRQKDSKSHFMFNYRISNFDAAKIFEYITKIPHQAEQPRDSKGKFTTLQQLAKPRRLSDD